MADDLELLRRFATAGDDDAFRELVGRHLDLVYSVALRQVNGDAHLAEDVAQSVFADLARKARRLSRRVILSGWLFDAARFAGAKAVRQLELNSNADGPANKRRRRWTIPRLNRHRT